MKSDEMKTKEHLIQELHDLRQELADTKEREKCFHAIADYTADIENWVGPDGKLLWVNRLVCEITGYSAEECLNMTDYPMPLIYEPDRAKARQCFTNAIQGKSDSDVDLRIICKDGGIKWVSASWRPMYDEDGCNLGHRSSIRDITKRKALEELLSISEKNFQSLFQAIKDPILLIDKEGKVLTANNAVASCLNMHTEDVIGRNIYALVPPELAEIRQRMADKVIQTGKPIEFEDKDKSNGRWTRSNIYPCFDTGGSMSGLVIYAVETTEYKRLSKALQFTQFAIDRTEDAAFWMTSDAKIFYVNDATCKIMGYTREEMLKMNVADFDPEFPLDRWSDHWAELREKKYLVFESTHRTKDGRLYPVEIRANYVEFDGQEYNCAFARDITVQKKTMEELKKHRDSLAKMVEARTAELEKKSLTLEETNTTLRVLLDHREKDKEVLQDNIMFNVQELVMPYIDKLKIRPLGTQEDAYLSALEYALQNIISPFAKRLASKTWNFTSREIQVSNLIRDGKSTKEISHILNLSVRAIEFHRDHIRKKLGLNKTNTNLRSYLLSLP